MINVSLVHRFFSINEMNEWYALKSELEKIGIIVLTPLPRIATDENALDILTKELDAFEKSEYIIIWRDTKDSGAAFMWGLGIGMKKKILTFSIKGEDLTTPMLKVCVHKHFKNLSDLLCFLEDETEKRKIDFLEEETERRKSEWLKKRKKREL